MSKTATIRIGDTAKLGERSVTVIDIDFRRKTVTLKIVATEHVVILRGSNEVIEPKTK